ncbi:MAG: hypothetical protein AAFR87_07255 [Bacteroidota bacterium]
MPLEKAKLQAEKKRYAAISSGMFLLMLLMIAGLAYVSWDNARKNSKLKQQDQELQAKKDSLEDSNTALWEKQVELERTQLALKFANLKYETFVDSIISEGDRMQKQKAMEVKSTVSHVSDEIKDNKNIREDAENIERIERELVEQAEELSQEEKDKKNAEIQKIQRQNPSLNAVIEAQDRVVSYEQNAPKPATAESRSPNDPNAPRYETILSRTGEDTWIKEGYFRNHKGENGGGVKIEVDDLKPGSAKITCSFLFDRGIDPWTMNIKEGQTKTKDYLNGRYKVIFKYLRNGAAGKNPFKKAVFYELKVLKRI